MFSTRVQTRAVAGTNENKVRETEKAGSSQLWEKREASGLQLSIGAAR